MIKTGHGKQYFCSKCEAEINYARILYRASLCNECYKEMEEELEK